MVNYYPPALDATFGALADPTRRALLARLARGEATVGQLAAPFDVSLPAVSKHLRVLEAAGLLHREIDGRVHRCRLVAKPMRDAADWIEHYRRFWEDQFDALALYLESANQEENRLWQHPSREPRSSSSASSGPRSRRRSKKSLRPGPSAST